MKRRSAASGWAQSFARGWATITRSALKSGHRALRQTLLSPLPAPAKKAKTAKRVQRPAAGPAPGAGAWIPGVALGAAGARRFRLYRPPDMRFGERLPLLVMLHGCGQDAEAFAASTRMNRLAERERFLVLYPEQDWLANGQGCWNWFDTRSGRAYGEAGLIMQAIDQICLLHSADRGRVAIAGLSAGASMAALLVTQHPGRFKAVVMHSGIPPGTAHSGLSALGAMHGHRATLPLAATPVTMAALWPQLLVIHGAADGVVSPQNAQAAAQVWASAAGARPGPTRNIQRGRRYPMAVTDFKRRGSTVATLVEVGQLAHAWSGGAARQSHSDPRGPDASRMVWAFAARQFRA